jgi:Ca2+-binding RTX toxin-like protein
LIDNLALQDGNDLLVNSGKVTGMIYLNEGQDTFLGGATDEIIDAGLGDDYIDGGAGVDTFDTFIINSMNVTVDLRITTHQNTGYGFDRLINIDNINTHSGKDILFGNDSANTFNSGYEDDELRGYGGSDILAGSGGNDILDGGQGDDTAVFSGPSKDHHISTSNNVTTITDKLGDESTDTLTSIRFLKFRDETIALHNAAPTSLSLSTTVVAETALVNTPVVTLSAQDADGDALTYSLNDPSGTFKLEGNTLRLV